MPETGWSARYTTWSDPGTGLASPAPPGGQSRGWAAPTNGPAGAGAVATPTHDGPPSTGGAVTYMT
jgi:hypothetical protein